MLRGVVGFDEGLHSTGTLQVGGGKVRSSGLVAVEGAVERGTALEVLLAICRRRPAIPGGGRAGKPGGPLEGVAAAAAAVGTLEVVLPAVETPGPLWVVLAVG